MNMRQASKRDRQKEAWTKLPEDVAAAVTRFAAEQEVSEYETIRRLLYVGMLASTAATEWHEKKHGKPLMSERTYRDFLRLCEREMQWSMHGIEPKGRAKEALQRS